MVNVGLDSIAFDWVKKFFFYRKKSCSSCGVQFSIFYIIITQQLNINGNSNEAEKKNNGNERISSGKWENVVSYD